MRWSVTRLGLLDVVAIAIFVMAVGFFELLALERDTESISLAFQIIATGSLVGWATVRFVVLVITGPTGKR